MASVELVGLAKRFGAQAAVQELDLSIADGEFFSLLGPSGCGKTTTLRMVAGLEEPSAGQVRIGGADVTRVPPHRRDIGMVFQNYALFPHLDVAGNVGYGLAARQVPRAERGPRVAEALAQVALAGYQSRRIDALSGGQQQRVAVARATVLRPALLLLDEPLSNLDARLRVETRAMLRRVQRELGATAIYVTHDQDEALTLSDRLAVLKDGVLQQVGPPAEVYRRPANAFVASFLGRANLLAVEVCEADGDRRVVRLPGGGALPLADAGVTAPRDGLAQLCVRPEAIEFGSRGPAGTVTSSSFVGPWFEYEVAVDGQTWAVVQPNRATPPVAPGTAVRLTFAPEAGCLLPWSGDES